MELLFQEFHSQLDDLLNFTQASQDISDPIGELYDGTSGNSSTFSNRQQIYEIQIALRWEELVDTIQHLTDILRN